MLNNIKSQYEKLEEPASDLLWEKLEKKLDDNQSQSLIPNAEINNQPFEKKWTRYAAAVVLLLTLGNVIWMLSPKEQQPNVIVKEIIKTEVIPAQSNDIKQNTTENNQKTEQNLAIEQPNSIDNNLPLKTEILKENTNPIILEQPVIVQNKKEELLATQNKSEKIEKPKYVNASDLLFSAELDKTRKEQSSPNSKLGLNDIKSHPKDPNNFSPKSLKIFGITVYESDSLTQK